MLLRVDVTGADLPPRCGWCPRGRASCPRDAGSWSRSRAPVAVRHGRCGDGAVTELLLILLALLLALACAVFVAAEISLTTVDRSQVQQAARAGERGAARVLEAVRQLTFQLSGAQLGMSVTSLVIGMVAEPSVSTALR